MTVVTIDVNEYLERIETNMSSYTCSIQNTKIRNLKTETYGYRNRISNTRSVGNHFSLTLNTLKITVIVYGEKLTTSTRSIFFCRKKKINQSGKSG